MITQAPLFAMLGQPHMKNYYDQNLLGVSDHVRIFNVTQLASALALILFRPDFPDIVTTDLSGSDCTGFGFEHNRY